MEQKTQIIAKKCWNVVRVIYLMLRKGISKAKLFSDLSLMFKRGKIAGKSAIYNLMFHHHASAAASATSRCSSPAADYEFSCTNSPAYPALFFHRRKHSPPPAPTEADLMAAALEVFTSAASSPALPGLMSPYPVVRQLRITDSPFPAWPEGEIHSGTVDKAADAFIRKFYSELKKQNAVAYLDYDKS